jgi:hypothetical protein
MKCTLLFQQLNLLNLGETMAARQRADAGQAQLTAQALVIKKMFSGLNFEGTTSTSTSTGIIPGLLPGIILAS